MSNFSTNVNINRDYFFFDVWCSQARSNLIFGTQKKSYIIIIKEGLLILFISFKTIPRALIGGACLCVCVRARSVFYANVKLAQLFIRIGVVKMNRTDGLVRRNKNRGDNGSSEPNSSTANSVDDNDVIINERDDEIDDNDSKETRLTLMEEVLLLGLKDKEVHKINNETDDVACTLNYALHNRIREPESARVDQI